MKRRAASRPTHEEPFVLRLLLGVIVMLGVLRPLEQITLAARKLRRLEASLKPAVKGAVRVAQVPFMTDELE